MCASPEYLKRQGHPQAPSAIAKHDCLLFPLAGFRSRWIFRDAVGETCEVSVHGRTVISNAIALQHCAIAGLGITLLPHWLVDEDVQSGRLVDLFPAYEVTATDFNTAAWLVYPSRAYVPLKVKAFTDLLQHSV